MLIGLLRVDFHVEKVQFHVERVNFHVDPSPQSPLSCSESRFSCWGAQSKPISMSLNLLGAHFYVVWPPQSPISCRKVQFHVGGVDFYVRLLYQS